MARLTELDGLIGGRKAYFDWKAGRPDGSKGTVAEYLNDYRSRGGGDGEDGGTGSSPSTEDGAEAGRLSADSGGGSGVGTADDSSDRTTKPRGRPRKPAGTGGTGGGSAKLRERLVEDGAGLLSLGFGAMGSYRARPFRRDAHLAQLVERCWHVPPETARHVSEPLASMLDRYLPEAAKNTLEVGLDPATILVGMYRIITHCQENEKRLIEHYIATQRQSAAAGGDKTPDVVELREEAASFNAIGVEG